jgi:predicted nucleic acid-binding protein
LALEGEVELVTSPPLLAEFGRVLTEKFGWQAEISGSAVAQVLRIGTLVRPVRHLRVVIDDPADDRVLEEAAEGGAEAIVSGDRHLLRLAAWEGIRILKPAAFLDTRGTDFHGV